MLLNGMKGHSGLRMLPKKNIPLTGATHMTCGDKKHRLAGKNSGNTQICSTADGTKGKFLSTSTHETAENLMADC